jgi:hypothetical protein
MRGTGETGLACASATISAGHSGGLGVGHGAGLWRSAVVAMSSSMALTT